MPATLAEVVTRAALRRLAGRRSFERGLDYARLGAVSGLQCDEASISAAVQGGVPTSG